MSRMRPILIGISAVAALLLWAGVAWCQEPRSDAGGAREKPRPAEGFQPGDDAPPGPRDRPRPPRDEGFGPAMGPPRAGAPGRPGGPPRDQPRPRGPRPKDGPDRPGPPKGFGDPGMEGPHAMPAPGSPDMMFGEGGPLGFLEGWQTLQKSDPEMYKLRRADSDLERESRQLAMQYRQAPEDQKEGIQAKLEKLVLKHFEVRQQRRTLELKRLEAELQRLRDSIEKRNKAREQIVKKRVSELLGLDEGTRF